MNQLGMVPSRPWNPDGRVGIALAAGISFVKDSPSR
jgi:hypothetical protein